jgi:hypothetical protein
LSLHPIEIQRSRLSRSLVKTVHASRRGRCADDALVGHAIVEARLHEAVTGTAAKIKMSSSLSHGA